MALISLGLAHNLPSTSISSVFIYLNIYMLHSLLYLVVSWAWWDWSMSLLTSDYPPVITVGWVIWPLKLSPKWPIMCRVGH